MLVATDVGSPSVDKVVLGSIWVPLTDRGFFELDQKILRLRTDRRCWGEFKWSKSKSSEDIRETYRQLASTFLQHGNACFSCVVIEKDILRRTGQHMGRNIDEALPNFTYLLLSRRAPQYCRSASELTVLLDRGEYRGRETEVRDLFDDHLRRGQNPQELQNIRHIQEAHSHITPMLQLADLFTGAVTQRVNGTRSGEDRTFLCDYLEGQGINLSEPTYPSETKFNIWHWNPHPVVVRDGRTWIQA